MSLHYKKRDKYLSQIAQGATLDEVANSMLEDGVDQSDIDAFKANADALKSEEDTEEEETKEETPQQIATVGAKNFDYKNMKGKTFEEYQAFVATLPTYSHYDFNEYQVKAIIEDRYPGIKDTPRDIVGFALVKDAPLKKTRIDIRTANELNAQLRESGRYYLLIQD